MNRFLLVGLLFILIPLVSQGQDLPQESGYERSLDSLRSLTAIQWSTDSLKLNVWSDSLRGRIVSKFSIDSLNISDRIDSLRSLSLSTEKYTAKLDSLTAKKDKLLNEVDAKKQQLLAKTKGRLEKWKSKVMEQSGKANLSGLPEGVREKLPDVSSIQSNIPAGLPDTNLSIPNMDEYTNQLNLDGLGDMPSLNISEFESVDLSPDLSSLSKDISFDGLDKLQGISSEVGEIGEKINGLGDIAGNPDKAIDAAIENVDQLDGIKEQLGGADAIMDNEFMETAEKLKDPAALQEEAKQVVVQKAVNHFAGKEEVLNQAMETLAKYKQKYESLNSLSDIKKRPPNAMKGKPFIERLVPGVALQVLKNSEEVLLDVNPYAGYRITGRLTSGAGWNQRIGYSLDHHYFTSPSVVYGPRLFTEFKTWRGFVVRVEGELLNTEVPASILRRQSDTDRREWVRSAFVGLKKEFRFIKSVRGTTFIMFSVYNDHRKSPYGDVVNSRFGFEFLLKRNRSAKTKTVSSS